MRTIQLGNRRVTMTGSALTPFFYRKEFGRSLTLDAALISVIEKADKADDLDDVAILCVLQIAWAMEKTTRLGRLIDFKSWLATLGEQVDLKTPLTSIKEEVAGATQYVAPDYKQDQEQEESVYSYELSLIVIAKKLGFSFSEINALSLQDLMDIVDIWTNSGKDAPKKATQKDIDAFYGM